MTSEPTERLRVATYNVHGCVGMDGQRSEDRIAEVIASMSADIVGLQELDLGRARSSHADQAALIATRLGWKYHFHPAMRSGEEQYGNAIVSRFPIELKRADEMPGTPPWYCREQRIAIWMRAETDLGPVHIINSHFGLGRTERRLQAKFLIGPTWLGSVPADEPDARKQFPRFADRGAHPFPFHGEAVRLRFSSQIPIHAKSCRFQT